MDRIKEAKRRRLEAEADERIKQVEKLMGIQPKPYCKYCKLHVEMFGHSVTCDLRFISPDSIKQQIDENIKKMRKEANKQRIFKGSGGTGWSGVPGKRTKSLVKRRSSKNRGPARALRYCGVCEKRTLFVNKRCRECEHERPCGYNPLGNKNCQLCFPEE